MPKPGEIDMRMAGQQQKIWELPELEVNPAGLKDEQSGSAAAAFKALTERLKELQKRFTPNGE
ncbi:hypothetical protein ACC709_37200, partial [Rhizobium ruizarguesonis]